MHHLLVVSHSFLFVLIPLLGIFCICYSLMLAGEEINSKCDAVVKVVLSLMAIAFVCFYLSSDFGAFSILCGAILIVIELKNIAIIVKEFFCNN